MNLGYGATGSSPELSSKLQYFREGHDETVMNRDRLLSRAISIIGEMQDNYIAPQKPGIQLASKNLSEKMDEFMQAGVDRGDFMPHDKTVALTIGAIMLNDTDDDGHCDETVFFERERRAFMSLAKTKETYARISSMLDYGSPIRN